MSKNIILDIGHLHPAFEGVAAIDWLLAGDKGAEIKIGRLSHPLIFAGLLWWAGHIYQQAFILSIKDTQETIHLPYSDIGPVSALSRLTGQISIQPGDRASLGFFCASWPQCGSWQGLGSPAGTGCTHLCS